MSDAMTNNIVQMLTDCMDAYAEVQDEFNLHIRGEDRHKCFEPSNSLMCSNKALYLYHLRELFARVRDSISLEFATRAEVMCVLSATSLTAMLNRTGDTLYCRLYLECYNTLPMPDVPTQTELHEGAADEMLVAMQKKHRKIGRKRA